MSEASQRLKKLLAAEVARFLEENADVRPEDVLRALEGMHRTFSKSIEEKVDV